MELVFPEENLVAVFTRWEILKDTAPTKDLIDRLLPAFKQKAGGETGIWEKKELIRSVWECLANEYEQPCRTEENRDQW